MSEPNPKPKPQTPEGDPENPSEPGESTAGRGGIISPGGQIPAPEWEEGDPNAPPKPEQQ